MNKANGGDGIPVKLFQILKDDAVASSVVLEKTLKSPLDCKEIQPVHSKGDQSWVFFGRIDAKAETPVLWPPHAKRSEERRVGKEWKQCQTLFWGAPKSLQMVTAAMKLKDTPWKENYDQPR